jgi:hypothetical protein
VHASTEDKSDDWKDKFYEELERVLGMRVHMNLVMVMGLDL